MYKTSFAANNSTTTGTYGPYTNKKEARKIIRRICEGNTFEGNTGKWQVFEWHPVNGAGEVVYSGITK